MGDQGGYNFRDLSKLYRAWEKHYGKLGLSYNKMLKVVNKKVRLLKCPPGYNLNKLVKFYI